MLRKLLEIVASGQAGNTADLAAALRTSPALVEAMVRELERRGALQRIGDCGVACSGCPAETACGPQAGAWILTRDGHHSLGT